MHLIVCLDDRNGMAFNRRRQSMDRQLQAHMLNFVSGKQLWMNPYSASQFAQLPDSVQVDENFLENCPKDAYCFIELGHFEEYLPSAEQIVVYRWNRTYPADLRFPESALMERRCVLREDFAGYSHETLTLEVYSHG